MKKKSKETVFTKKQLIDAKKYQDYQDVLQILLKEESYYSISETDQKIIEFMKGKVK